jgi:ABC-2 type transport system permease protein
MSVVDRSYRAYAGSLTSERTRFLILTRFALKNAVSARLVQLLLTVSVMASLVFLVIIYLHHNLNAIAAFEIRLDRLIPIDERFFYAFLQTQTAIGFLITALVGPGLISADLAHGALPLYLARPLSRSEYILGKGLALAIILSLVTWLPGLLLVVFQSFLTADWFGAHARIAPAVFLGASAWIVMLTLLVLAISAWVRWRPVAGAMLFGVAAIGTGLGAAIALTLDLPAGYMLSPAMLFRTAWTGLLGLPLDDMPFGPGLAWIGIAGFATLSLGLLSLRVKPQEVVR